MRTSTIALLLALPAFAGPAAAEVVMLEETPSVEELRSYLAPEAARRTRGIEIVGQASAAPSMAAQASATMAMPQMPMAAEPQASMAEPQAQPTTPEPEPAARPAAMTAPEPQAAAPAEPTTIGFRVQFAYDSAEILPDSRPFLDQLGQVLQSEPGLALVVEGHTDARGSEAYNQTLSLRRAEAVRAYLGQAWQVPASRLTVAGKGESEPLTADRNDGTNRRVQFRPL